MNTILSILLGVAGIVALLLILAYFMKREHFVKCEITINAPRQKVFDYLKFLKNQDQWNTNAKADPDRKEEFIGTDGTVGFIISWNGNKNVGEGQKEIKYILDGKRIETEIRFVRPMSAIAAIIMETESLANADKNRDQTKVTMSNAGILKYPLNLMIPLFEKMFAKQLNSSLSNLKTILEK
jgi:hypothetical protein